MDKLHSPLLTTGSSKRPVLVTKLKVKVGSENKMVDFDPKPKPFFPEGKETFWVSLFVDGYVHDI